MEVETALKRSGRRQRRRDTDRRLTDTRDYFQHCRYGERADGIASPPRAELNAVRSQVESLESSRSVVPLDPRHELLYELLCLREKELAKGSVRRRRGRVEEVPRANSNGRARRDHLP